VELVLSLIEGLTQGLPTDESVPPVGQPAGVGPGETNIAGIQMKEEGTIILYDPFFRAEHRLVVWWNPYHSLFDASPGMLISDILSYVQDLLVCYR